MRERSASSLRYGATREGANRSGHAWRTPSGVAAADLAGTLVTRRIRSRASRTRPLTGERRKKVYRVLEVDAVNGTVRAVISEETNTFFAYRPVAGSTDTGKNWRFDIDDGKEVLWMSERDGWNHVYLVRWLVRPVKNQVTKGDRVQLAVTHWESRASQEHRAIAAAARQKDTRRACALLRQHILSAGQSLVTFLRDQRDAEGSKVRTGRA